jgi:hypothetical protein
MGKTDIDTNKVDDAVLALMYLTLHDANRFSGLARAWKSFDWATMNRLYEKDLIFDPVNKAKSVVLTEEGLKRSEALFHELFAKRDHDATSSAAGGA